MHLIDTARAHIETHFRRPMRERLLRNMIAFTLSRPGIVRALLKLSGLARLLRPFLPATLRNILEMIPRQPRAIGRPLRAGRYSAAEGTRCVALLAGCVQQVLNENINAATIRVLNRHGCHVVISDGAGCCGSLALHMGREDEARALARTNVSAWYRDLGASGIEALLVNASGCGTTVKDYGHLFAGEGTEEREAKVVAASARDISEFVQTLNLARRHDGFAYRVAYHDPCSIRHGQRIIEPPRDILRKLGFHVLDVPEAHFCCGSAGTYNILHPETAGTLGLRKARHIEATDPDIIATGNIGCIVQIARFTTLPVVHWIELADWATGGALPSALEGVRLRAPAPQSKVSGEAEAKSDLGFW
jgi:glycolate oxidase iron-sulfur subunit